MKKTNFSSLLIFALIVACAIFNGCKKESSKNISGITINTVPQSQRKTLPKDLGKTEFGTIFTDHIFIMDWDKENGWHKARIEPYHNLNIDPAFVGLHYGSLIFEGLKAHKTKDNHIVLFRPRDHFERMNKSAKRMCMPAIDIDFVLSALKLLIKEDSSWVPSENGTSLYVRPIMMASESTVNLKVAKNFIFYIILSPVGAFYKEGFNPVSILVSEKYSRSAPGGVGAAKTAGNYAASMLAQKEAKDAGFSQVLWLDPKEHKYVEEVGTMNIFFVINNKIVTPALTDTILSGITRKSVIEISKFLGLAVEERRISIDEVISAIKNNSCSEIFGTGTAAVISPVGKLHYKGKTLLINNNQTGPVTKLIFENLSKIQRNEISNKFNWLEPID